MGKKIYKTHKSIKDIWFVYRVMEGVLVTANLLYSIAVRNCI